MLDKDWKEKWIEALRSGKFTQDYGQLRSSKGYCCLGVLCHIAYGDDPDYTIGGVDGWKNLPTIHHIPEDLMRHSRLKTLDIDNLISMNDSSDYSFFDIADWIEREL